MVPPSEEKARLREQLLAARRARGTDELTRARDAVAAEVLARAAARHWRTVAAYEPMRTEPGSLDLLHQLHAAGILVLVPVTLDDRDLSWTSLPDRADHGVAGIACADAVLAPALAVGRDGTRLGRGGGSYDRALARCTPLAERVALLFDGELLDAVPAERWDEPVDAVITPSGYLAVRNTAVARDI